MRLNRFEWQRTETVELGEADRGYWSEWGDSNSRPLRTESDVIESNINLEFDTDTSLSDQRAVGYSRVSTTTQTGGNHGSLETQQCTHSARMGQKASGDCLLIVRTLWVVDCTIVCAEKSESEPPFASAGSVPCDRL